MLVVGLFALAGISLWQAYQSAQSRTAAHMVGTAHALALLVDQEFAHTEALLKGLAVAPEISRGDVGAFLAVVRRFDGALNGLGMTLAEAPDARDLGPPGGGQAKPAELSAGIARVFATGTTTISNLYRSPTTAAAVVSVAVPVRPIGGGPPRHVVSAALDRDRLAAVLRHQDWPEGAIAAVHDRNGTVVARSVAADETVGRPAPSRLLDSLSNAEAGMVSNVAIPEGGSALIAFARAPVSGYTAAIAVPDGVFARERNLGLARFAATTLPIAGAAMGAAFFLALRLRRALAGLPAGVAGPDAGGPRIAEVEDLRKALVASDEAREATEAALRDQTTWLEQTQRAAAIGFWQREMHDGVLRWSEPMWRLLGVAPDRLGELTRESFRSLVLEEDRGRLASAEAEALRTGEYRAEYRIRRDDGSIRWIRSQGVLERAPDGTPRRLIGANLDITDRRALEDEREKLLAQKDLLAAEIHHRIKNSLQLVQGLLLMQARNAAPEVAARLREAAARIISIAAVHRQLYEGAGPSGPVQDVGMHLAALTDGLRRSLGSPARQVALDVAPDVQLAPERMAALGLLVTELVTNALKYGAGTVTVRLRAERTAHAEEAAVEVEDEGSGFPPEFDPARVRGLGTRLALAMARQLRGTLTIGPRSRVTARFPIRLPSPSHAAPVASR